MKYLIELLNKNKFLIAILLILTLAVFLRVYNFENRWSLGSDESRDIAIAREALSRGELPLIGSFSSAGPFVFGPLFYWTLMASYLLFPFTFYAPHILNIILSIVTVGVLCVCGYLLGGKKLAMIIGILTATSAQLVNRALTLGQHSYISLFTSLTILFLILYWQKKKGVYAFLLGISIGCGISFHYQAINILILVPALLFVPKISFPKRLFALIICIVGFFIPSIPLLIWDTRQEFANINNILDYLLIAQYRLYVPNSWSLFLFNFLPSYWSFVIGKEHWLAIFTMFITLATMLYYSLTKKITGIVFALSISFYILLLVNKYYKGERSEGYLIYLAPFLIIFTSWTISKFLNYNLNSVRQRLISIFGILFLIILLLGNFLAASIQLRTVNQASEINRVISSLEKKYPGSKFAIYDFRGQNGHQSQPLSLFLKIKNMSDPNGLPIGVSSTFDVYNLKNPLITKISGKYIVFLNKAKEKVLRKNKWIKVDQEDMYDDLIGWSKKNELKSSFSLYSYILDKIQFKK